MLLMGYRKYENCNKIHNAQPVMKSKPNSNTNIGLGPIFYFRLTLLEMMLHLVNETITPNSVLLRFVLKKNTKRVMFFSFYAKTRLFNFFEDYFKPLIKSIKLSNP